MSLIGDVLDLLSVSGEENAQIPRFDDELARLQWSDLNNELVLGFLRTNEIVDVDQEKTGERALADFGRHDLWVRWRHDFNDDVQATLQASRFSADRVRSGTTEQGEDVNGRLDERRSYRIVTLTNRWRWTPGRNTEVNAGLSYLRHHTDVDASMAVRYGRIGLPIQDTHREVRDLVFHRSGSSSHVYGSITRALTDRTTATVGLRYDGQDLAEVDAKAWSGRLAIDYRISPAWRIDLDFGRYNQPQFLHEIQIDEGRVELDPPQHADQLEPWRVLVGHFTPDASKRHLRAPGR